MLICLFPWHIAIFEKKSHHLNLKAFKSKDISVAPFNSVTSSHQENCCVPSSEHSGIHRLVVVILTKSH